MIRITNIDLFGVESQFQALKIAFIKSAHIQIHYEWVRKQVHLPLRVSCKNIDIQKLIKGFTIIDMSMTPFYIYFTA